MPRPTRAQGRPGTRVIPIAWSSDHAPVATKTMNGTCELLPPGEGPLVFDPAEKVSRRGDVTPTYTGPCRIQKLNAQDRTQVVAEQTVTSVGYLITLSLDVLDANDRPAADQVTTAHRVHVTGNTNGPALVGEHLTITSIAKGTERFEIDLFCIEDQSTPTT